MNEAGVLAALLRQLGKPVAWLKLGFTLLIAYAIWRAGRALLGALSGRIPDRLERPLRVAWALICLYGALVASVHALWLPGAGFLFDQGALLIDAVQARAGQVVVVLALALIAWNLITLAARRTLAGAPAGDFSRRLVRTQTLTGVIEGTLRVVVVILTLISILQALGINATALLAGVSVLGLAVGFGAQSLIKDLFTGFFILLEDQYGVGDVITVNTTTLSGTVESLSLRVTNLRALDGTVHIVPNGQIQTVSVSSKDWSQVVATVDISYTANIDAALRVLAAVVQELYADPQWQARFIGDPDVQGVTQLGAEGVRLRALLRVQPKAQFPVSREFNRRIKIAMDEAGIVLPSPQRSVSVTGPVDVRLVAPAPVTPPAPAPPEAGKPAQDRQRSPITPSESREDPESSEDPAPA